MELADKSLGDLLRRLPIICLEDSFLHPDMPFMVWLMVAYSKVRREKLDIIYERCALLSVEISKSANHYQSSSAFLSEMMFLLLGFHPPSSADR